MLISYAKGARTWERHIDVQYEGVDVSSYCSLPEQCDDWYKAYHRASEMCGGHSESKRAISKKEIEYLDKLVRGIYANKTLPVGYEFFRESLEKDFFLAVPLHKGQLSCREIMNGEKLTKELKANEMLTIDHIDGPYAENKDLRKFILARGI
jgi:N-acetylneuraminate synthase